MTYIDDLIEKVRKIQELRYSLISREEWKNLKLIKNNLEYHDKQKCKVCDAVIHSDKCWRCKFPQSREYRMIQFLTTNRNRRTPI